MTIKSDRWIRRMALEHGMIEPFVENQVRDGVISYGTLAHCALAYGKPTVFIYPYPSHTLDDGSGEPTHWEEYRDFVAYPASIGTAPLDELFQVDVAEWVEQFVGGPLDLDKLEKFLLAFRPNRATRRKLALAA